MPFTRSRICFFKDLLTSDIVGFFVSYMAMAGAVNDGYATVSTDAGLEGASDPRPWALLSPGNVNLYKLENFGSRSLNEQVNRPRARADDNCSTLTPFRPFSGSH